MKSTERELNMKVTSLPSPHGDGEVLPPHGEKLQLFGSLLERAGHRSAAACMSAVKNQHSSGAFVVRTLLMDHLLGFQRAFQLNMASLRRAMLS